MFARSSWKFRCLRSKALHALLGRRRPRRLRLSVLKVSSNYKFTIFTGDLCHNSFHLLLLLHIFLSFFWRYLGPRFSSGNSYNSLFFIRSCTSSITDIASCSLSPSRDVSSKQYCIGSDSDSESDSVSVSLNHASWCFWQSLITRAGCHSQSTAK